MSESLITLLGRLDAARVLVIGDVMLDRYVMGSVQRISPEAPIPVLLQTSERTVLGGAGNVVRNLCALGATVSLLGVIAGDAAGNAVRDDLNSLGVRVRLHEVADRPTAIKTRYLAGTQQLLRVDAEKTGALNAAVAAALLRDVATLAADADIIILSDYGKGLLSDAVCQAAIASGKPVIVDPKGTDYHAYRGAAYITPNRHELAAATSMPVSSNDEVTAAAEKLRVQHGFSAVIATRSEQGISIISAKPPVHLPTVAREVFDVSGAGDTVVAMLAAALAAGAALIDAAQLANAAAGIVVGKRGTAVAATAEIQHYLKRRSANSGSKIYALGELVALRALWREKGLLVGFTNGCFDIIHAGHAAMLGECRARCDVLIVGLNSDASVRRLKGSSRPVNDETSRSAVLAALGAVDAVVLFGEDTPMHLLETLQPERLFKGSDYTRDTVVGADFVESYGGRVELIDLLEGHSTTAVIARMKR